MDNNNKKRKVADDSRDLDLDLTPDQKSWFSRGFDRQTIGAYDVNSHYAINNKMTEPLLVKHYDAEKNLYVFTNIDRSVFKIVNPVTDTVTLLYTINIGGKNKTRSKKTFKRKTYKK
jgi:hypothetical protein